MVAIRYDLLFCSVYSFISLAYCFPFRNIPNSNICEETCAKKYEENLFVASCERGCHFYSIIELIEDDLRGTSTSCHENCDEAYKEGKENEACDLGCDSQTSFKNKLDSMMNPNLSLDGGTGDMMSPFLYMHDIYSNMVEKARHHMTVSWSFFMQNGTGRLVVIKSQPHMIDLDQAQDFDDYTLYRGTSAGLIETNIEASDNTATEMLKHSQINAARSVGDVVQVPGNSDWLTCIAHKTGIPRVLLCILILMSALAMIWLCMSAAVTSPDHRVLQSVIKYDLNYLKNLDEKDGIKGIHPQDFVEAHPLPAKLRIEQI